MGTRTRSVCPRLVYSSTVVAVCGPSQALGPTCDCQHSRYGLEKPSRFMTAHTVAATSAGYGSPRLTTDIGRLCAEKRITTSERRSAGYSESLASMLRATASTRPGCVGHLSMTLHWIVPLSLA